MQVSFASTDLEAVKLAIKVGMQPVDLLSTSTANDEFSGPTVGFSNVATAQEDDSSSGVNLPAPSQAAQRILQELGEISVQCLVQCNQSITECAAQHLTMCM